MNLTAACRRVTASFCMFAWNAYGIIHYNGVWRKVPSGQRRKRLSPVVCPCVHLLSPPVSRTALSGEIGIINATADMSGFSVGLELRLSPTKYSAEFRIRDPLKVGRVNWVCSAMLVKQANGYGEGVVFKPHRDPDGDIVFPKCTKLITLLALSSRIIGEHANQ
jgi:hypothetical protein